jgi:hypothetical protein
MALQEQSVNTFDLRAYSEGWQEHRQEWMSQGCGSGFIRMIPTPGGYLVGLQHPVRLWVLDASIARKGPVPSWAGPITNNGELR